MKFSVIVTKRAVIIFALTFSLVCLLALCFKAENKTRKNAETENERIAFLRNLGIDNPCLDKSKQITVPTEFSSVYENYNNLQKQAGFDLTLYKGVKATHYSYAVNGSGNTLFANLIVYNGRIIGGDISSVSLCGEMMPLTKGGVKKCLK